MVFKNLKCDLFIYSSIFFLLCKLMLTAVKMELVQINCSTGFR